MEDKIKLLEIEVELLRDINTHMKYILSTLREDSKNAISVFNFAKKNDSTGDCSKFEFNRKQLEVIENVLYSVKSEELVSQRSSDYLKEISKEIKIKQKILSTLN